MSRFSVKYIYHDCFLVETASASFLFDYWKDPLSVGQNKDFPPLLAEINKDKPLYILVSHHHKDHFTKRIFLWDTLFPNVHYIISHDVYKAVQYLFNTDGNYRGQKPDINKVNVLSPGEKYSDSTVKIVAFGSTDIGNSYALETDGLRIFHAGDLNAWLWLDESTPEEVEEARTSYIEIVTEIKADFPQFDLVMFPVDSRQGREYWWGAKYFVDSILTSLFLPMHFELVLSEEEKEQRRIDAAAFTFFARKDYGEYLQLASTRSLYLSAPTPR